MREPVSPLISTSLCLRIVRRLLDDETLTTSQLSYLVENIFEPLTGSEGGSSGAATGSPVPGGTAHDVETMREMLRSSHVLTQLRKAREVRVSRTASESTTPAPLAAPQRPGRHGVAEVTDLSTPVTVPAEAGTRVLSSEQQWCLFANLATLYRAQLVMMAKLTKAVQQLTELLEKLQHCAEAREWEEWVPDTAHTEESSPAATGTQWARAADDDETSPVPMAVKETEKEETASAAAPLPVAPRSSLPRDHASTSSPLQSQQSQAAPASADDDGGYNELAAILSDLFTGDWVSHYAAEHMMYTAQFTAKMAPKVLELGRLWRWGAVEAVTASSTASVSAAALATSAVSGAAVLRALGTTAGRKTLSSYAAFIDYVYRSFSATGIPEDVRVAYATMPEDSCKVRLRRLRAETLEIDLFSSASGQSRRATPPVPSGVVGAPRGGAPASKAGELPSMVADWAGFEAFLVLLATPLSCLRRHHHACRCILESGALLRKGRQHLTRHYVDVLSAHMVEEGTLVASELGQMDVAHVVQLLDDVTSTDDPHLPGVLQRLRSASLGSSGTFARLMIHYGRLKKRYGRGGRHERLVLLFSDCFCYAEESRNGRLRPRGGAGLDVVRVLDTPEGYEGDDAENAIELVLQPVTKRLIFYADTPEQKWQWVEAIRFAGRQYRRWLAQQRKTAPSNASTASASASTSEGVNLGVQPLPSRPTVFSHSSRLGRQQRSDQRWQEFLETQRFLATSAAAAAAPTPTHASPSVPLAAPTGSTPADSSARRSAMALPLSSVSRRGSTSSPGGQGGLAAAQTGGSGASEVATLPPASSFNSSFATVGGGPSAAGVSGFGGGAALQRSQTQIEYDITPWSHQSSLPRRLRSQEPSMVALPPALPSGASSQMNLTDGGSSAMGAGDVHSYTTSPARGVAVPGALPAGPGRPPTASTTNTPLRVPLMDRVNPSAPSLALLPPASPLAMSTSGRPRAGRRSASGTAATSPNRALQFDNDSRGADTQPGTPGHPELLPPPPGAGEKPTSAPLTVPVAAITVPTLVADTDYDNDLEKLMNEHFESPNSPLDGIGGSAGGCGGGGGGRASCTSSSHSTLIEDHGGENLASVSADPTGAFRATPEEVAGASAVSDGMRRSSTVSEGHSSFRDDDEGVSPTVEDSLVAVTAFSCPPPGRSAGSPLTSLTARLQQPLSPDLGSTDLSVGQAVQGGDGDGDGDAASWTTTEAAPPSKSGPRKPKAAHVDPNAALNLDTREL